MRQHRSYYQDWMTSLCQAVVPVGARVLEIGCAEGELLAALRPSRGLGIDTDEAAIRTAWERYPQLQFEVADAHNFVSDDTFDYIVLADVVNHLSDVHTAFDRVRALCHEQTRIVVATNNPAWQGAMQLAERFHFKRQGGQNWIGMADIRLTDFAVQTEGTTLLVPIRIGQVSDAVNFALTPLPRMVDGRLQSRRTPLGLIQYFVLQPARTAEAGLGRRGQATPAAIAQQRRRARLIKEAVSKWGDPKVLELGCGDGSFSRYLLDELPNLRLIGCDGSPAAIAAAQAHYQFTHARVSFVAADPTCLPFANQSFEAVVGDAGEHLSECYRVLRPGGIVWFSLPNPRHSQNHSMSPSHLAETLQAIGFDQVSIEPYDFLHPMMPAPLVGVMARVGPMMEKVPVLRDMSGSLLITARRP